MLHDRAHELARPYEGASLLRRALFSYGDECEFVYRLEQLLRLASMLSDALQPQYAGRDSLAAAGTEGKRIGIAVTSHLQQAPPTQ